MEKLKIFIKLILRALMSLTIIIPIKRNRVLFTNYFGKSGYGCNLKYIAEEMYADAQDFEIFWAINNVDSIKAPDYITIVKQGSLKWFWILITSQFWIDNQRKHLYLFKKKSQVYIQTWHGGLALKRIELDAVESYPEKASYLAERHYDNKIANVYISNSDFCTNMYRNSFAYDGEIWETGYPRNDILVVPDEEVKAKVYHYFAIDNQVKFILYAPTFRTDKGLDFYDLDFEGVIKTCSEKFGGEFKVIVRLHPNVADKASHISYSANVLDGSKYDDIQELMMASEILVTDYSNVMFEFSYQLKPCFLYAKDLEEYTQERNFYFDYNTLPYPKATSHQSLETEILGFNHETYKAGVQHFFETVGLNEPGNAAKSVVSKLKTY